MFEKSFSYIELQNVSVFHLCKFNDFFQMFSVNQHQPVFNENVGILGYMVMYHCCFSTSAVHSSKEV